MSDERIIAYIEGRAEAYRTKAERGEPGWATLRHDARTLMALASDIRAGLHEGGKHE